MSEIQGKDVEYKQTNNVTGNKITIKFTHFDGDTY
jgi:hypothetical protein